MGEDKGKALEITEKMIEAGIEAFLDHDSRFEGARDAVIEIYLAMAQAKEGDARSASDTAKES